MKLIVVHGIQRTNRFWEDLVNLDSVKNNKIEILPFDYDYFSGFRFAIPSQRRKIINRFAQFYSDNIKSTDQPPCVIAHSFGTVVVFEAMKTFDVVKFENVILCGSILHSKTDLRPFFEQKQINYLLNDYGTREWFIRGARILSKNFGRAGRVGFTDIPSHFKNKIENRKSHKAHSDYFLPLNMEVNWIGEVIKRIEFTDFNKNILHQRVIDRIYEKSFKFQNKTIINSLILNARIDLDGNYYAKYRINGLSQFGEIKNYEFITMADGFHNLEKMNFKIYDNLSHNRLHFDEGTDINHKKSIIIKPNGQNFGHNIDHSIYFSWYNTINFKTGDTDHWEVSDAQKISIQINIPFKLKKAQFITVNEKKTRLCIYPTFCDELDGTHSYSINIENPNSKIEGLVFYFEGIDNNHVNKSLTFIPKTINIAPKKTVSVHNAQLTDIPKLYKIEVDIENSNAASEETLRQRLLMFRNGFLTIKDTSTSKIIGYLESIIWNDKDFETFEEISNFPMHYNIRGTTMYIIFLAVDTIYRKKGFGTILLNSVEERAKAHGLKNVTLVAKSDLVQFYEKRGYRVIKKLPRFLPGKEYESIKMIKELIN